MPTAVRCEDSFVEKIVRHNNVMIDELPENDNNTLPVTAVSKRPLTSPFVWFSSLKRSSDDSRRNKAALHKSFMIPLVNEVGKTPHLDYISNAAGFISSDLVKLEGYVSSLVKDYDDVSVGYLILRFQEPWVRLETKDRGDMKLDLKTRGVHPCWYCRTFQGIGPCSNDPL
ncbi:hypothetical protein Tco_0861233 [Tanacetum coccineum]|uniref:Uncharacterized protein n=1 Tax=Tanacetum coccineum TaxID=301880 RepID=A0ABQ5BKK4_9ASTR